MIKLKEIKHYPDTNSVEATWVDELSPATVDAEGNPVAAVEVAVKCHSYADSQMDMLEADLGAGAADHATLINTVRANVKPPEPPKPLTPQEELNALDSANMLTQRNLREFILLTVEAIKQLSGGAVDLSQVRGVSVVADVEREAEKLREKL